MHTRNQRKPPRSCKLVVAKQELLGFLLQVEEEVPVCVLEPGLALCALEPGAAAAATVAAAWLLACCLFASATATLLVPLPLP